MKVLSPVGRFSTTINGVRIVDGRPVVQASMGAWRSEVILERRDVGVLLLAVGAVAAGTLMAEHRILRSWRQARRMHQA
jgi:hypothetical protein